MPGHGQLGGVAVKPKNPIATIKRFAKSLKEERWILLAVVIFTIASAVMAIVTPVILRDTLNDIDVLFDQTKLPLMVVKWDLLFERFGLMMGLYVGSAVLMWVADWIMVKTTAMFTYNLHKQIKAKLDRMPLAYFDSQTYGEVLSRGTNDIDNINRNLNSIVEQSVSGVTLLIGVSIAMFITSWELALVVMATLPIMIAIVGFLVWKSQKQFVIYRKKYGMLESAVEEGYSGLKVLKAFNQEKDAQTKFDAINEDMTEADRKSQWISGFIFPAMRFIYQIGFVAVSVTAGLITGDTIGDLVAFILFLGMFQQPFQQIGQISSIIQSVIVSIERIYSLMDSPELIPDAPGCIDTNENVKGEIEFKNVNFSYDPSKPLIQNMNIHVEPGETVAIVGPTGAGKTTLVNLIMRFYEVDSGEIILDGRNITGYTRAALRDSIGMVLQDTWLFNGSIRDNIRYGRNNATDAEIEEAASEAHADHFIKTLPGGYDFMLNEDGTNISQGQRQLLTIARAIVSNPKIMILDEATSSVDTRTEQAIQDAMQKLIEKHTSFVIAHRLSTIKNAKLILVMNKGEIVEMGNHQELLAANGFYADLYNSQFLGRNPLAPQEKES